jgi:hypothetical protein
VGVLVVQPQVQKNLNSERVGYCFLRSAHLLHKATRNSRVKMATNPLSMSQDFLGELSSTLVNVRRRLNKARHTAIERIVHGRSFAHRDQPVGEKFSIGFCCENQLALDTKILRLVTKRALVWIKPHKSFFL